MSFSLLFPGSKAKCTALGSQVFAVIGRWSRGCLGIFYGGSLEVLLQLLLHVRGLSSWVSEEWFQASHQWNPQLGGQGYIQAGKQTWVWLGAPRAAAVLVGGTEQRVHHGYVAMSSGRSVIDMIPRDMFVSVLCDSSIGAMAALCLHLSLSISTLATAVLSALSCQQIMSAWSMHAFQC